MTLRERIIVETYTGYCMTSADERDEVYKYRETLLGRPVYSLEVGNAEVQKQLREKSLPDFIALCREE